MECLLKGVESEELVLNIPHGKLTMNINSANPNYIFFVKQFWNEFGRKMKLKYGNCHLGLEAENLARESMESVESPWLTQMEVFEVYVTPKGRFAITADFKGKDGADYHFRKAMAEQSDTFSAFLSFLDGKL